MHWRRRGSKMHLIVQEWELVHTDLYATICGVVFYGQNRRKQVWGEGVALQEPDKCCPRCMALHLKPENSQIELTLTSDEQEQFAEAAGKSRAAAFLFSHIFHSNASNTLAIVPMWVRIARALIRLEYHARFPTRPLRVPFTSGTLAEKLIALLQA